MASNEIDLNDSVDHIINLEEIYDKEINYISWLKKNPNYRNSQKIKNDLNDLFQESIRPRISLIIKSITEKYQSVSPDPQIKMSYEIMDINKLIAEIKGKLCSRYEKDEGFFGKVWKSQLETAVSELEVEIARREKEIAVLKNIEERKGKIKKHPNQGRVLTNAPVKTITWLKTEKQFARLMCELVAHGYILYENIWKIADNHFEDKDGNKFNRNTLEQEALKCEEKLAEKNPQIPRRKINKSAIRTKIKWLHAHSQLAWLIKQLQLLDFIRTENIWVSTAYHFINKNEKRFDIKDLGSKASIYKDRQIKEMSEPYQIMQIILQDISSDTHH
jgi:hypothetical protein